MNRPATTWPTTVPTSVTRPTTSELLLFSVIDFWVSSIQLLICESLALSGPSRSQSRICSRPSTTCPARSCAPVAICWPTKVSSAITHDQPADHDQAGTEALGACRSAASPGRPGWTSAAISSAMTSGSTTTAKNAVSHSSSQVPAAMTSSRQAQAAARSSAQGTCARVKLEGPEVIATGSARRSARTIAHCWANWWDSRSASPSSSVSRERPRRSRRRRSSAASVPAAVRCPGRRAPRSSLAFSPTAVGTRPSGPSASFVTPTGYPSTRRRVRRYAASGCAAASRPAAAST